MTTHTAIANTTLSNCSLTRPVVSDAFFYTALSIDPTSFIWIGNYFVPASDLVTKLQLLDQLIALYLPEELI